jgi:hypothetical protein
MVEYCAKRPSPICHGLIEHQLGGAVRRVDRDAEYSFMSLAWIIHDSSSQKETDALKG